MTAERPLLFDAGVWIASQDVEDPRYLAARELVLDDSLDPAALDLTLYERSPHGHQGPCLARARDHARRGRLTLSS